MMNCVVFKSSIKNVAIKSSKLYVKIQHTLFTHHLLDLLDQGVSSSQLLALNDMETALSVLALGYRGS